MIIPLEEIVEQLTNEELENAFNEIEKWHVDGTLEDGVVRKVYNEFKKSVPNYPLYAIEAPILFEIAKRHYKK